MIDIDAIVERRKEFHRRYTANEIRDDEWKELAKQAHNDADMLLVYFHDQVQQTEINQSAHPDSAKQTEEICS